MNFVTTTSIIISTLCLLISITYYVSGHVLVNNTNCVIDDSLPEGIDFVEDNVGSNMTGTIVIIGDINDVMQGIVTEDAEQRIWTGATTGVIGVGDGTLGSLNAMGEGMYINGIEICRTTDNGTANYFRTETGNQFRTQFSAFVTHGALRNGEVSVKFREPNNITLAELYSKVYEAIDRKPFCFYGLTQFAQLDAIAISKAPVYGEPLFDHSDAYYSQPNFELLNEFGVMMGCAANFDHVSDQGLLRKLRKFLYINPLDPGSDFTTHTHGVSLKECLGSVDEIEPGMVKGVYHMLSNSTIRVAKISVFVLSGEDSLIEL